MSLPTLGVDLHPAIREAGMLLDAQRGADRSHAALSDPAHAKLLGSSERGVLLHEVILQPVDQACSIWVKHVYVLVA